MNFLKSHFALSKSQQNGIFLLVLLIVVFQVFIFIDFSGDEETNNVDPEKIENFTNQLDSLNRIDPKIRDTIYPFNPNYLTDFKGYQLGMTVEQIDRLIKYRSSKKWINSAEDFQKVTGIPDSLLLKISPSFRFPEWTKKSSFKGLPNKEPASSLSSLDLNLANAGDLKSVNGVGDVLSQRIVKYRSSIGGFLSPIQLRDVYGLSSEVITRIEEKFKILTKPDVNIKNLNSISEAELTDIPYFNERIAKEIITYRKLHEGISSFEELSKINDFPSDKIDRIKLYLAIE